MKNACDCTTINQKNVDYVNEKMIDEKTTEQVANIFKVFGNDTRIKILWALYNKELCVCDLAVILNMTKSAISHQLKLLRESKLVKNRRDGKTIYYSLDDKHIEQIIKIGLEHAKEHKDES